jgi:transposase
MQGFERPEPGLWDISALAGHLLPEGGMFAFLARNRAVVFPDADYADLFAPPGFGRPSVPATRMAAIMTLQVLHDYSDRETAEAVRYDLRWKLAAGLALEDRGFDPSTLVYWRRRLAKSARPDRISDAVKAVVAQTGILKGRRRVADSTIMADAVASQDAVTQLIAAVRRAGRVVPGAAGVIAAQCTGHDYGQPRRPVINWGDPSAVQDLVSGLVADANTVVAALKDAELDREAAEALALLALVAGQDVEPAEGSDGTDGRWRIAARTAEDRMVSQVDPEARHARKNRHTRTDGYRAHLAAEPSTGIITDEELTQASGDGNADAAAAARFVAREHAAAGAGAEAAARQVPDAPAGGEPLRWYGDSAYGTGELREAIRAAGDQAVIKPRPLRAPVAGGFTADDFTVDHQAGTATCPAGVTRRITPARVANFGAACRGCPLRGRCTTSKAGRSLELHEHDQLLRQARRDWAGDPALRQDYRTGRPPVERAVAQVATTRGRRIKLRYRGTAANHAWLKRRTAAINLRSLLRHGLTRAGGTWILTPATG